VDATLSEMLDEEKKNFDELLRVTRHLHQQRFFGRLQIGLPDGILAYHKFYFGVL
jgi:CRISPR/Cas system CSM-associated protein Csm2 small subunit